MMTPSSATEAAAVGRLAISPATDFADDRFHAARAAIEQRPTARLIVLYGLRSSASLLPSLAQYCAEQNLRLVLADDERPDNWFSAFEQPFVDIEAWRRWPRAALALVDVADPTTAMARFDAVCARPDVDYVFLPTAPIAGLQSAAPLVTRGAAPPTPASV